MLFPLVLHYTLIFLSLKIHILKILQLNLPVAIVHSLLQWHCSLLKISSISPSLANVKVAKTATVFLRSSLESMPSSLTEGS